ncbi:MAG: hypothetical protein OQJ74_05495, partial [Ignavibacteriaceae bacterium]|nr:hypothetical protein [Ignavibacteriaceae bacterium]
NIIVRNCYYFLVWVLFFFMNQMSFSQIDSSIVASISLNDGTELRGFIIAENDSAIDFRTISGINMKIKKNLVDDISLSKGEIFEGKFQRYDPNRTRLFFGPTARTVEQGKGYFSAYEIFIPFLAVGVTDFLMLSGGVSLIPGAEEQLIYLGPKVRFLNLDNFSLAGGIIYAHVEDVDFGVAYGVTTIGSERYSFTVGVGYGYEDWEFSDSPVLMLGGEIQASNSIKFLTENWIIPSSETGLISFGIRFFGDNLAADFGLMTTTEGMGEGFPFLPWIGFAYNW